MDTIQRSSAEERMKIAGFFGDYRIFSNFWPVDVMLDGIVYPSVEHAYQAAKTLIEEERMLIRLCSRPGQAKRAGKRVTMRRGWGTIKRDIMRDLLLQKFTQAPFKQMLLATGKALLEETNTWGDTYWGVCNGVGRNVLGQLLMDIRYDLAIVDALSGGDDE